ncbi:hypothetical protein DY000_02052621 [Brassica cretica]|uniref:Uncharacterized protein n=1 Tax=Brassica cretica TaxID=69181 RepID=A0ABQ7AJU9_BRACR|nr:hypothetical protein DY000_02052621 [Brassica cretica]
MSSSLHDSPLHDSLQVEGRGSWVSSQRTSVSASLTSPDTFRIGTISSSLYPIGIARVGSS